MYKKKRLGLVLSACEKRLVAQLADLEGGLSQAALVRRLIRKAGEDRGLWPQGRSEASGNARRASTNPPDLRLSK